MKLMAARRTSSSHIYVSRGADPHDPTRFSMTYAHVDQARAREWTQQEVIERWIQLFARPPLIERWEQGGCDEAEREIAEGLIELWQHRLCGVSWHMRSLMRSLNEPSLGSPMQRMAVRVASGPVFCSVQNRQITGAARRNWPAHRHGVRRFESDSRRDRSDAGRI